MNYYQRTVTVKDYQGKWHKAVYVVIAIARINMNPFIGDLICDDGN